MFHNFSAIWNVLMKPVVGLVCILSSQFVANRMVTSFLNDLSLHRFLSLSLCNSLIFQNILKKQILQNVCFLSDLLLNS